jgi:hypothetical protein
MTTDKYNSLWDAFLQINDCNFECEAGPLANNVAWQWLTKAVQEGPRFFPGQTVYYRVVAEVHGEKFERQSQFTIVGCQMKTGITGPREWLYTIAKTPPSAWHNGSEFIAAMQHEITGSVA